VKPLKILLIISTVLFLAFCASSRKKTAVERENDPQYQCDKAVVAMNYGLEDQAITYLNQALALDPMHIRAQNLLGLAFVKKERFKEAAAALEKGLELQPKNSNTHFHLGAVYEKLGMNEEAEAEYKKAIEIDSSPDASFNLAVLYFRQEKLETALDFVRKSIEAQDNSAQAYNLQGVILNKMKKVQEAIKSFQQALKITPKDVSIGVNLAVAFINNRDYEKARRILETILPHSQDPSLKDKINEYLKMIKDKK
jgi:Flp pilus assembly protein TadD